MESKPKQAIDVETLPAHPEVQGSRGPADVEVKEEYLSVIVDGKPQDIFSRRTVPEGSSAKLTVLLLHGQAFTSRNWQDIGTLQRLALWGYQAVGVDLPGYGQSKSVPSTQHTSDLVAALVEKIGSKPVIVSPSMSGRFSLPYLFDNPRESCQRALAYVPVAPVMTGSFKDKYPVSQIRTLIVYGSTDDNLGIRSRSDLQALPNSTIAVIPDAGHACYLNQPALFHNLLFDFLAKVSAEVK